MVRRVRTHKLFAGKCEMSDSSMRLWLAAVEKQRSSRGLPVQPPATTAQLDALVAETQSRLSMVIPEGHLNLLGMMNGMDENSLAVFSAQRSRDLVSDVRGPESVISGLVEANVFIRENTPECAHLLVLASGTMHYYALDCDSGLYVSQPTDLDPPDETFDNYEALMVHAIGKILRPQFMPSEENP